MIRISISELHMKTGDWVRKAAHVGGIVVTDRGRPIAKLASLVAEDEGKPFAARRLVKGFSKLPRSAGDSSVYVAEDRERA